MRRAQFEQMLKHRTNRRRFLAGTASAAALTTAISLPGRTTRLGLAQTGSDGTPVAAVHSTTFYTYPFQLGVASGEPLPGGVVLWTRLAPTPIDGGGMDFIPYEVRWEVASDDQFNDVVQTGTAVASPELVHSVHVDVTGLEPATEYYYRFMAGSDVSPVGRTKTAPAPGAAVDQMRFGFASCSNYEHGYFVAYRDMARQNFDLIFHLGDYMYEYEANDYLVRDEENVRQVPGDETNTLTEYRNRLALYHTDSDLQMAHASAPWMVTWDDHEFDNNYADLISEEEVPFDEFRQRRVDSYQAYYEHMPLRPSSAPVGPDMQLYRRLSYGSLADFNVLDTRQYRSDQPCGDGVYPRCPAAFDPNTTMLGPEQERWLLQNLTDSDATWNVMAQQIMMAQMEQGSGEQDEYYNEAWSGYPEARNRILSHIMSRDIANPVVLTGDIHTSWANDLKADWDDIDSETIATEYICTSITAGGMNPATFFEQYLDAAPFIKFFDPRHGGYTAVALTPELWRSDFYHVDNMEDPDSPVTNAASFVTEAGNPGVQEA